MSKAACQHDPFRLKCSLVIESNSFTETRLRCVECNSAVQVYRSGRPATAPKKGLVVFDQQQNNQPYVT